MLHRSDPDSEAPWAGAVVLFTTLPAVGGNSTITFRLARQLRGRGLRVVIVVKHSGAEGHCARTAAQLAALGCRLHHWAGIRGLAAVLVALSAETQCTPAVFVSVGMRWGSVLLAALGNYAGSWFYMIQHDAALGPLRALGPAIRIFDGIAAISPVSVAPTRVRLGRRPTVFWLPQFSGTGASPNFEKSATKPTAVGFLGQLTESKGTRVVLDLWRAHPELPSLIVVGDGPLRPEVEAAAVADPRIVYRGGFSAERSAEVLPAFFREVRLLLVPITRDGDGIPTVILEAAAQGVPTLCTDLGGLAAFVGDLRPAVPGLIMAVPPREFPDALLAWLGRSHAAAESPAAACVAYFETHFADPPVWRRWRRLLPGPFPVV